MVFPNNHSPLVAIWKDIEYTAALHESHRLKPSIIAEPKRGPTGAHFRKTLIYGPLAPGRTGTGRITPELPRRTTWSGISILPKIPGQHVDYSGLYTIRQAEALVLLVQDEALEGRCVSRGVSFYGLRSGVLTIMGYGRVGVILLYFDVLWKQGMIFLIKNN